MRFLREEKPYLSVLDEKALSEKVFEFTVKQEDYFLKYFVIWEVVNSHVFSITCGNANFSIPGGLFVLCGDEDGAFDWVLIDELVGRDIPVTFLTTGLRFWKNDTVSFTGVSDKDWYFPSSPHIFPMTDDSGDTVILVSKYDQYHKTKNLVSDIFYV